MTSYEIMAMSNGIVASAPTFNEAMIKDFVAYLGVTNPRTLKTYGHGVKRFFTWLTSNGVSAPTREDVIAYRDALLRETETPRDPNKPDSRKMLTVSSARMYFGAARALLSWLAVSGRYRLIVDERLKIKDKSHGAHTKRSFSLDEIDEMLSKLGTVGTRAKRDRAMFILMLTCGLRTIEVARANVGSIVVHKGKTQLKVQGKGHDREDRRVNLPEAALSAIREYLAARSEDMNGAELDKASPLFVSISNRNDGGRLTTRTVSGLVKRLIDELREVRKELEGDTTITAHSLRRTFAETAKDNGVPLLKIRDGLRHASAKTTERYFDDDDVAENPIFDIVSEAIFGRSAQAQGATA